MTQPHVPAGTKEDPILTTQHYFRRCKNVILRAVQDILGHADPKSDPLWACRWSYRKVRGHIVIDLGGLLFPGD